MSYGAFIQWLGFAWRPENDGQKLHLTPGDPGGATNMGVTWATFKAWRAQNGQPLPTSTDFANATNDELADILYTNFWCAVMANNLPDGLSLLVADAAMMSSPNRGARELQTALHVTVDGRIGDETLAAISKFTPTEIVNSFATNYEAYLALVPGSIRFARGWDRRIDQARAMALQIIGGTVGSPSGAASIS